MGTPDSSPGQEVNPKEGQSGKALFKWFIPGPHDHFEIDATHHNQRIVIVKKITKENPAASHGLLKIIEVRQIGLEQIQAVDEYIHESILPEMDGYDGEAAREIYLRMNFINKIRKRLDRKKSK